MKSKDETSSKALTVPTLPDDDFFEFESAADATVVCDTTDSGQVLKKDFNFETSTCLIYSEIVTIQDDLILPGKSLGIFCSSLRLGPDVSQINVSGASEAQNTRDPQTTTAGTDGYDAGPGGNLWVYVEQLDTGALNTLSLKADGGYGGPGGYTTAPGLQGGKGGSGGNAGSVTYMFGTISATMISQLFGCRSQSWISVVGTCQQNVLPLLPNLVSEGLAQDTADAFSQLVARYNRFVSAVTSTANFSGVILGLSTTTTSTRKPSQELLKALQPIMDGLQSLTRSFEGPDLQDDEMSLGLEAVTSALNLWLASPSDESDAEVIEVVGQVSVETWSSTPNSSLRNALLPSKWGDPDTIFGALAGVVSNLTLAAQAQCSAMPGIGGPGGQSADSSLPSSPSGPNGLPGTATATPFFQDGRLSESNVSQAYAFPEQCQMLLDKADQLYFSNDTVRWEDAAVLYRRLTRRLSFLPNIPADYAGLPPSSLPLLCQAYDDLEDQYNLTISAISQLQSVCGRATSMLNQILLGRDMFASQPNWVPRLSVDFYLSAASDMVTSLQTLESAVNAYQEAYVGQTDVKKSIESGQGAADGLLAQAQDKITILSATNGPVMVSINLIAFYTPLLKDKRNEIHSLINEVIEDIRNAITLDPQTIVDAFATLAMAPTGLEALGQAASVDFTASTDIPDSTGELVNKNYVISQISEAGNSLESLSEGFTARADHTLEPDDPGAIKLLSDENTINSLLDKYKSAIPSSSAATLGKALDEYLALVKKRNDAVMSYNAALELLHQAYIDQAYAQSRMQNFGQQAEKLDPYLPAIIFWLKQTTNSHRLDAMRLIDMAARAMSYWGLIPVPNYSQSGPLEDAEALSLSCENVKSAFESALLTNYGDMFVTRWPNPGQQGTLCHLTFGQLAQLMFKNTDDSGNDLYSLVLDLAPGTLDPATGTPLFSGHRNIRLSCIRLWIIGVEVEKDLVGRKFVTITMSMLGEEKIVDVSDIEWTFSHDPIQTSFQYDSAGISSFQDCQPSRAFDSQSFSGCWQGGSSQSVNVNSIAPVGPWATWQFQLSSTENPGLNMEGVTDAALEFCGMSATVLKR